LDWCCRTTAVHRAGRAPERRATPASAAILDEPGYRLWGVPIPAVVCGKCFETDRGAFVRDPRFFEHVAALFARDGADAWWGRPLEDGGAPPPGPAPFIPYADLAERMARLLPEGVVCPSCGSPDMFSRGFNYIFFAQQAIATNQAKVFAECVAALPCGRP